MYIDPGTGSVIFQILIASLLGAGVLIRIFWKKIVTLFSKKTETPTDPNETMHTDDGEGK
jgi:hypothetical protein